MNLSSPILLEKLASLFGIQTTYATIDGTIVKAKSEVLWAIFKSLGLPLNQESDLAEVFRGKLQNQWDTPLEPVILSWDQELLLVPVKLPSFQLESQIHFSLDLESGEKKTHSTELKDSHLLSQQKINNTPYEIRSFELPFTLPWGYHRLLFEIGNKKNEALLIAAPKKTYSPETGMKKWGLFIPLYALNSRHSWGAGDFSDLKNLISWTSKLGGSVVGTLPLLSAFAEDQPSPYWPVSRLFWNEFYINPEITMEFHNNPKAQNFVASPDFRKEIRRYQKEPLVSYASVTKLKRSVLEILACDFWEHKNLDRHQLFQSFVEKNPEVKTYASFRALREKKDSQQYHLYVQWIAENQIKNLAPLFLDFPLGTHPDGFDVWRYPDLFLQNVSVGAPPDPFFEEGQNWGFSPLHPEALRAQGYGYLIQALRHHLRYASILRMDHIMGLHRLFWIPHGLKATDGVYVRYRAEELYALLCLESHRYQTEIVGEDLGTVPPEVRPAMKEHGIKRTFVLQFEIDPKKPDLLPPVPAESLATLNTHDLPPFAAFWNGENSAMEALKKYLFFLAQSEAQIMLINLEDLWLEKEPQNRPGTSHELNWRRKARFTLEEFEKNRGIMDILKEVNQLRREKRG